MIRRLEELAMRAWPALETVESDGWVLRFSEGYTRRANSVHPLEPGGCRLADKMGEAEELYAERGLPTIFKLTPASLPETLDEALAARGYAVEARTLVYVAEALPHDDGGILIETAPARAARWREAFHRMSDVPPHRQAIHERILAAIPWATAFATVEEEGRTVGCALGVVESEWLGIFDVIVDHAVRRHGYGELLTRGLMGWGCRAGATTAYLQVMAGNLPALALYQKLGFRERYGYWYRVKR